MAGIFISYRRSDAAGWAGRLSDGLRSHLGRAVIFRDIDSIPPGAEFEASIAEATGSCDVLLALIGPQWLTASAQGGQRRLDEPHDLTRLEIGTALSRKVRVIPVLFGGARMPSVEELPEELKPLARRQAYEVTDTRWAEDCRKLAQALKPLVTRRDSRRLRLVLSMAVAASLAGAGVAALQWRQPIAERGADEQAAQVRTPPERTVAATVKVDGEKLAQELATQIAYPAYVGGRVGIFLMKPNGRDPRRLTDWVGHFPFGSGLSWSPDGRRIAFVAGLSGKPEVYVIETDGSNVTPLTRHKMSDLGNGQLSVTSPAWSPDGTRIAYVSGIVRTDSAKKVVERNIYVANVDGTNPRRLTIPPGDHTEPSWSPDGKKLAFVSGVDCHLMNADGADPRRLISNCRWPAWSPDGIGIAYGSLVGGIYAIHIMNADGSNPRRLTHDRAMDSAPTWSPDGSQIAYLSGRGERFGDFEVYVIDADGTNQKRLTNTGGNARAPSWSPLLGK